MDYALPISLATLLGGAFAAGALTNEVRRLRGDIAELKKDAKDSAKGQGERIGAAEEDLKVLKDWRARTEGFKEGRRRERADTRGIPVGPTGRDESD